ncbi:MAG: hypothetical protein AAF437_04085 [Pseudomonadota bacterium]
MPQFLTRTTEEKLADRFPGVSAPTFTPEQVANQERALDAFQKSTPSSMISDPTFERGKDLQAFAPKAERHALDTGVAAFLNSISLGTAGAANDDSRDMLRKLREANPNAALVGDIAGYLAPGAGVLKAGTAGLKGLGRKFLRPDMTMKGKSRLAQGVRYGQGVVAPTTIAGGVDYGVYRGTVDATNRAAMDGRDSSVGERWGEFVEGVTSPEGYLFGAVTSPAYRLARGATTTASNSAKASKEAGRLTFAPGSFTPTPRAQWAAGLQQDNTPRARAYRMIAKRFKQDGITTEQLNQAIDRYHYAGYSTVDEMLFELAEAATENKGGGKLKQLAVALGSVGGDAQQTARANFDARKMQIPSRIREEMRKAVGLEGSDFYQYGRQIDEQARTAPKPYYDDAYARSISDHAWQRQLWPSLQASPSSQQAIVDAYGYARDLGQLEVAGEIADLLPAIGFRVDQTGRVAKAGATTSDGARPPVPSKPSTQALDYIDRMLGDSAQGIRTGSGRTELARGPAGAQARLRSVVDEPTGLNLGRDKFAELKSARDALDFGRDAAKRKIDLETMQEEFARKSAIYGSENIDAALLMGWLRGAEDVIETATNPGTAIRQLYGSERQRNKLLSMLPDGEGLGSGIKGDKTKRQRVLTGGEREDGHLMEGRFDRSRRFLDSQNEIVGNSQTGQRNEAVNAQGGLQRLANTVADVVLEPRQAANQAIRAGINRMARPGIFNEDVNRELGDILFTSGKSDLKRIVGDLDRFQKQPKRAPGGLPMLPHAASAEQGLMDRIAAGGRGSERGAIRIGGGPPRRLKDVMKDATQNQFPVSQSVRMPPGGLPQMPRKGPDNRRGLMSSPLPVLAAVGVAGAATLEGISRINRPKAASLPTKPVDLQDIRQEFMNDYADILTNVSARQGLIESRMARVQQIDRLMEREAQRDGQPPASPEIERARQEIINGLIKKIRHAPQTDLRAYHDKLDRIDELIASGGVPALRPEGVPPTPSLKPALPQL